MSDPIKRVRLVVRQEFPDGDFIDTEYVSAPASDTPDPYVRDRMSPAGETVPSEIITEFGEAPERPSTYPAMLPFIPNRPVFITESRSGVSPVGARWLCGDPEVVLEAVVRASMSDGWRESTPLPNHRLVGYPSVVLERDDMLRELQVFHIESTALVQLWDLPAAAMR